MKLNEVFNTSTSPASFEELLVSMKRSFGVDFGLKRPPINISKLHSDPKIAKALADKMESKLHTAVANNNITLNISYDDKTAVLNLVYDADEKTVHCKLDNDYSFNI